ncbi:MAG: hypothetical protein V7641_440 [Blastocatellia bacterium]
MRFLRMSGIKSAISLLPVGLLVDKKVLSKVFRSAFYVFNSIIILITYLAPAYQARPQADKLTINVSQGVRGGNYNVTIRSTSCNGLKLDGATLVAPEGSGITFGQPNFGMDGCTISTMLSVAQSAPYGSVLIPVMKGDIKLGEVSFTISPPAFVMTPPRGSPGKEYDITIQSTDCDQNKLTGVELIAPAGSGINVKDVNSDVEKGCSLTAKISLESDAAFGDVYFRLRKDKTVIGLVPFTITAKPPGPVPPGLDPQIDVMWSVVPRNIVSDNFGRRVANQYYCIEVVIGNNSGYDLQIASAGFTIPGLMKKARALGYNNNYTIPTNSYKLTRGSIEWEQQIGPRNFTVNLIKGLGPILTGFTPFFHVTNHRANFSEGINIFSNPFEKGFEIIFPDKTIRNLDRLDDQILRDGLIIHNNLQVRTKVFISKDFLGIKESERRNDPQQVMLELGQLVIIGDKIQHINRVQISGANEGGPVAPPPTVNPENQVVKQGDKDKVLLYSGTSLEKVAVTSPNPSIVQVKEVTTAEGGRSFKVKVDVEKDAKPGFYSFTVDASQGDAQRRFQVPFTIEAADIVADLSKPTSQPIAKAQLTGGQDVDIEITGDFLKGAEVVPIEDAATKGFTVKVTDNTANDKLKATVHVPENTSGDFKLEVRNNGKSKQIPITIGKQDVPQVTSAITYDDAKPNVTKISKAMSFPITITGQNLKGANVKPLKDARDQNIKIDVDRDSSTDSEIKATVTGPAGVPAQTYAIDVLNSGGKIAQSIDLIVKKQDALEIPDKPDYQSNQPPKPGETARITIKGKNLDGAVLTDTTGQLNISDVKTRDDQITATIKVPAGMQPGSYKLDVRNSGDNKQLNFEVQATSPQ